MGNRIEGIFFGRQGGVSEGIYNSLNCGGRSTGDLPANVRQNRQYALDQINLNNGILLSLQQIHSADVVTVTEPWDMFDIAHWPKADAMVTNKPNIALGILTADCAPVLFQDGSNRVIGAAHAGWRGAIGGVLENTIAAMEKLGAQRDYIGFMVGPCIHQQSYEVSDDFRQNFINQNQDWHRFFIPSPRARHYQFDLPGFVTTRLIDAGLRNIDDEISVDTCSNEDQFFSYRRMTLRGEPDYGRQISVIALKD